MEEFATSNRSGDHAGHRTSGVQIPQVGVQMNCNKRSLMEVPSGSSGNMSGEKKRVLRVMSCKYPSNSPHAAAALIRGDPKGVVRKQRSSILKGKLPNSKRKRKEKRGRRPMPRRTRMQWSCQYPSNSNHDKKAMPSDVKCASTE